MELAGKAKVRLVGLKSV